MNLELEIASARTQRDALTAGSGEREEANVAKARRPRNVLLLSDRFRFGYRILRCFRAAGFNVHVLGAEPTRGLRYSRFCASFTERVNDTDGDLTPLIDEVNSFIARRDIDLVISGGHYIMGPLIAMAPALRAPCFPMLSIEQFSLLNDKWRFTQFCRSIGLRCPESRLFRDSAALRDAAASGEISRPFVVKPLDLDGNKGVMVIADEADLSKLNSIDYAPVIVQDFIAGADVAASVYCDHGEIKAFIAHRRSRATYFTVDSPDIFAGVEKIVGASKAHGVLNFDTRVGLDGSVYWLECNPRFFFWMHMSLLAGVPFAEFGLTDRRASGSGRAPSGTNVRFLAASTIELLRPWRLTKRDFAYLRFVLADPLPWLREALGIEAM